MSKRLIQEIAGIGLIVVGAATGNPQLIAEGVLIFGTALLAPKASPLQQATTSLKSSIPERVIANGTRRIWGAYILYETSSNGNTVDVLAFSDSRLGTVFQVYLNDDKVVVSGGFVQGDGVGDNRYKNDKVKVGWNTGLLTETAFAAVITEVPSIWTSAHRGDGVATGYVIKIKEKEKYFLNTYPQGDNVQLSLAAEWGIHFDPRDPAQDPYDQETWVHNENSASHFLSYLIRFRAFDWDTQGEPTRVLIEAALDDCDVMQSLAIGGSEARYRSCVMHKSTDEPAAIISEYLSTFDGWYCFNERNELVLYSGRYYEPTIILDSSQIMSYRDSGGTPIEDAINEIQITYISSLHDYVQVDAQPWRDEDAISASGRTPNTAQINAQTPSFTQNRRLAKRIMARVNAADKFTISTTYGGQQILGQRYINLIIQEGAYTGYSGPVEILTAPEFDMTTGGVSFECCTVDPNIDAWNPATEDGEGASVGDRIARDPLNTPLITSAEISTDDNVGDDNPGVRLLLTVSGPDRDDLAWFARWRVQGNSLWNEQPYSDIDPGPSVELLTGFVPANATIEVEISYSVADGRSSLWSELEEVTTTISIMLTETGESMAGENDQIMIKE